MLRAKKALGRREVRERAKGIRLLLLDVDGVLTDGRIVYGNAGLEVLAFHVRDGLDNITSLLIIDPIGRPDGVIHLHGLLQAGVV